MRYPQKFLPKVIRNILTPDEAKDFFPTAFEMGIDIYKTFSPIKQTTFTMVISIVELTALVTDQHVSKIRAIHLYKWHTNRACVVETMLDLLDLYTQFPKSTKLGVKFELAKFMDIKIKINQEVDNSRRLLRFQPWCDRCEADDREANPNPITPGSATSPATTGSNPGSGSVKRAGRSQEGTMRFVFDAEQARAEQDAVGEFFKEEFEEYEIEVEEPIPENEQRRPGRDRGGHHQHPRHNNHDTGWAPYPRNRHGNHHDRHKGRKGGGYY